MYEKWLDELIKVALFKDISKNELKSILDCLRPGIRTYRKQDMIAIEEDEITGIGVILEGEVIVGKENFTGDRLMMSRLEKGDLFGEAAVFASDKWLATVVADTDCTIMFLPSQKLVGVCNKSCTAHKKIIQNLLKIVSIKALYLNRKLEMLSLKSIRKKISAYLLEQYRIKNSLSFDIPLKRNELAEYLLVSRPSLSRELINMKQEGIIDFYRNSFKILDLDRL